MTDQPTNGQSGLQSRLHVTKNLLGILLCYLGKTIFRLSLLVQLLTSKIDTIQFQIIFYVFLNRFDDSLHSLRKQITKLLDVLRSDGVPGFQRNKKLLLVFSHVLRNFTPHHVGLLVGQLVGRSIGWSVSPLFTFFAFLSTRTRTRLGQPCILSRITHQAYKA